jgi:hypothetical protein
MGYNFIDQNIVSSCLIQAHTDDSFYNPVVNSHTGYAFDGSYYSLGVVDNSHIKASWFTEFGTNPFRGSQASFPQFGVALLSPFSLVILNQGTAVSHAEDLPLWIQFLLGDNNALANNFDGSVQGFTPSAVCYADGIISVTYVPDSGNQLYLHQTVVANPITATSIASNLLTVTVNNFFVPGQEVVLSGTAEAFLNGQTVKILGANATQFDATFTHANYSNGADTGSAIATLPIGIGQNAGGFFDVAPPVPFPNVPVQSHLVVSIDFSKDTVVLDVAV